MTETKEELQAQLKDAAGTIAAAVAMLRIVGPIMERYLKESRDMDNFGHVVDPTLWRDPERRAADALMRPMFEEALRLIAAYELHTGKARAALDRVKA
jgi:hypothetical protein